MELISVSVLFFIKEGVKLFFHMTSAPHKAALTEVRDTTQ